MKTTLILILSFLIFGFAYSGEFYGTSASKIIPGAVCIKTNDVTGFPDFIKFSDGNKLPVSKFKTWVNSYLLNPDENGFILRKSYNDNYGYTHLRYQQFYKNIPVDNAIFTLHVKDNLVESFSGNLFVNVSASNTVSLDAGQIIDIARSEMKSDIYKWEIEEEEKYLKIATSNPQATYYPQAGLIIYPENSNNFRICYSTCLYSHKPVDKKDFIIDASTGRIIEIRQRLYSADTQGTAVTRYSGNQTITADSYGGSFRLRETGRGNGIETYNANMGTSYAAATDFTDTDNYWNNVNPQQDEVATDAHWATEMTYDFLLQNFAFNSIDNNGFALLSYVHYNLVDAGYSSNVNAFWDGQRMTYGDGNTTYSPLTTVDIAAHEITHGLTEFNAGLIYQNESGALNEGYSDIFGTAVEFFAKPSMANWTIGEDIGGAFRSIQDPNSYGDPDTYHGVNWVFGTQDNGGVHTNSQVLGYWFYLTTAGGSGTNDIGNSYNVTGTGISASQEIAFRTLVVYLTPNANYDDARFFSILSAIDIFGPCTPQVESVTNAMYAIGLGNPYVADVVADFNSTVTSACTAPFTANFVNISNNSINFLWDFGDGSTSTAVSPSHTYNNVGDYDVTLISDGGACGSDTVVKYSYISVGPQNPCVVIMPFDGTGITQTSCSGTLYDGGGPTGNYTDNSDALITIAPVGAINVTLNFVSFDIEPGDQGFCNYDYLEFFDGNNTSAPSMGRFCNTTGSPGTIASTGGAMTILLHSDQGLNMAGFEANWICSLANSPPDADFTYTPANTCTGVINFFDSSVNGPTSWIWDFGDGATSTLQNPVHIYNNNGIYDVTLVATNNFGSDTVSYIGIININRPESPVVANDTICENEQAVLSATANGIVNWYVSDTSTTPFMTGNNYTTPPLAASETYYVDNSIIPPAQNVGDLRSSSGGSFFTSSVQHYLNFNCYSPCRLVSVEVNAGSAGNRTIQLKNSSGIVLNSATVNIPSGVSRIALNFDLPVENNLQLAGPLSPNLWRNNTGCTYPYQIPGLISIISSSASTDPTGYYYYFYDWEVKEPDCISARIPVTAEVEICQNITFFETAGVTVFPNPVTGYLVISNPELSEICNIVIKDLLGKEVVPVNIVSSDSRILIGCTNLAKGLYVMSFDIGSKRNMIKFVKQ